MRDFLKIVLSVLLVLIGLKVVFHVIGGVFAILVPLLLLGAIGWALSRLWGRKTYRRKSDQFFD